VISYILYLAFLGEEGTKTASGSGLGLRTPGLYCQARNLDAKVVVKRLALGP
jgi:hypothetical protein